MRQAVTNMGKINGKRVDTSQTQKGKMKTERERERELLTITYPSYLILVDTYGSLVEDFAAILLQGTRCTSKTKAFPEVMLYEAD